MMKKLLALALVCVLCVGLLPAGAQAMMQESDFGKWIGGTDPNCQHTNTSEPYGNPPDEGDHPGTHLKVVECSDCGAQFITRESCTDGNKDNKCDKCNEAMPVQATDINSATVNVNTIFGNNTEYLTGSDPITPSVSVYDANGNFMYEGSDYSVSYGANNAAGTGTIYLTGLSGGRLVGSRTVTFNIKTFNGNLASSQNTVILFGGNNDGTFNYTGSQIKPEVMVELDGNGTLWDSCYTVKYGPNVGPGQGSVTITGTGENAYGVSITGERTVYFKIVKEGGEECKHESTVCVSDGEYGHHFECSICGQDMSEGQILAHITEIVDEESGTHVFRMEKCQFCPWTKEIGQFWKLDKVPVTGLKAEGAIYTESEAKQIGLEGLTEGVDYTRTVTAGEKTWVVTLEPMEGKSVGSRQIELDKCKHDGGTTCVSDGDIGHHFECSICGQDMSEGQILAHITEIVDEESGTHVFRMEKCQFCPWTKEIGQLWKLDKVPVTGLKAEGAIYTESEAKQIGLEGLTEGIDYIRTVTAGEKTWVVTLEPMEGKSVGSRQIELDKCQHPDIVYVSDGDEGHHTHCNTCGEDLTEPNTYVHDIETVEDDAGTHVFITEKCKLCPWTKELGQRWKLDKAQIADVPAQEYNGEQITPEPEVTLDGEQLIKGQDFTYQYGENKEPGEGWVEIMSVEGKSKGSQKITFEITEKQASSCGHLTFVWGGNEQFHWEICTNCDHLSDPEAHAYEPEVVTAATCTQDAVIVMKCKCGRTDPNGRTAPIEGDPVEWFAHHTWGTAYSYDSWFHWQVCTVCNARSEEQKHTVTNVKADSEPTCLKDGFVSFDCPVCQGHIETVADEYLIARYPEFQQYGALGHDFTGLIKVCTGPNVCTSEGQGTHAPTCVRCGALDMTNRAAHSWTGLHNVQNGTCGDPNDLVVQEASCECGATLHIEKIREHVPVEDKSKDVQATCTESGKINGHRCTICGTFYDYDFVEALGHNWVVDEKVEATCLADGFIKSHCDRCKEEKTEILKMKSPDGKHHYAPQISKQPTCTEKGTANGEKCIYCDAEQGGETGYGEIPALGHLKRADANKKGQVREYVTSNGVITVTCYEVMFYCDRCGHALGVEYYTVGTNPKISKYLIEPGKDVKITDLGNGIHIDGNMADDGGVYFNGEIQNAFNELINLAAQKYTYKKVPANSFIIEFTDEFLAEQKDGGYTLEVINGSEYWPMIITIKDHKIVDVQPMDVPQDVPEWSMADYEAWTNQIKEAGSELKELLIGCPERKN